MSTKIRLHESEFCITVDDDILPAIQSIQWHPVIRNGQLHAIEGIAKLGDTRQKVSIEQFVTGDYTPNERFLHRDGDIFNCQRRNIRCMSSKHGATKKVMGGSGIHSKYKGVCREKYSNGNLRKQWTMQFIFNKKRVAMKRYNSEIEAARAYDEQVKKYYPNDPNVFLNFPTE